MIDLAGIGSLVSVLTGLMVAVGSLMLQRQRRQAVDADDMEDELEVRTEQFQAAMRCIRQHEDDRATLTDLPPLARPPQLRAGYFQQRTTKGKRHRADQYETDAGDADLDPGDTDGGAGPDERPAPRRHRRAGP